jgi:hypothetical protein
VALRLNRHSRCFMRPHLSFLVVVIALGASSAAIAASTSTSSGGGASSAGGGGAHGGGGGGGGHGGGVGGHAVSGGGFSNSGRFGSANLGRGSFSQAVGNHAADHAIGARTALRTASISGLDKKHPGNPEHHHHRWSNPAAFAGAFRSCATLGFDRDEDFIVSYSLLCGGALKAPTNPKTGRPAG